MCTDLIDDPLLKLRFFLFENLNLQSWSNCNNKIAAIINQQTLFEIFLKSFVHAASVFSNFLHNKQIKFIEIIEKKEPKLWPDLGIFYLHNMVQGGPRLIFTQIPTRWASYFFKKKLLWLI